jgi:hypothetical protein
MLGACRVIIEPEILIDMPFWRPRILADPFRIPYVSRIACLHRRFFVLSSRVSLKFLITLICPSCFCKHSYAWPALVDSHFQHRLMEHVFRPIRGLA